MSETLGGRATYVNLWPLSRRVLESRQLGRDPGDQALLERATSEARILVTIDTDFGELVYVRRFQHAGLVCGAETGFVLERRPDTVLAPDIAFVRRERIPATGRPRTFWDGPPDLAVEVRSPARLPPVPVTLGGPRAHGIRQPFSAECA